MHQEILLRNFVMSIMVVERQMRLKNLEDDDLVWATNENVSFAEKNESTQFSKCCDKAGFIEKYKPNNFRKITLYTIRYIFFEYFFWNSF